MTSSDILPLPPGEGGGEGTCVVERRWQRYSHPPHANSSPYNRPTMTSVVLAVLVLTLLLPGLTLLFAIVLRSLFHGPLPRVPRDRVEEEERPASDGNGHADTLH